MCGGRLVGVIGLDTVRKPKQWDSDTVALLEAVGCNLANAVARQRAEITLRRSEQRLQAILDNSPTIVSVKDLKGRYLHVNREYERLFNVKREQVIGQTDYDLFPREFADRFRANDKKVLASRGPVEFEEFAPLADGTHTYISNKFCLYDTDGEPYAICGISTDITERDRTARLLVQQEKFLRLSQRAAHVGSWEWDVDARTVRWSEEMYRIHGIAPEQFDGTFEAAMALVHPDDRERIAPKIPSLLTAGGDIELEYRIVRPDGTVRFAAATGAYIKDDDGRVTRALGIVRDVTERKRTEDALRQSERRLQAAQSLARLGHWEWDIANDIVYWSDELYRIVGRAQTTAPIGIDDYIGCVHPVDRPRVRRAVETALERGTPYQTEHCIVRPDGEERFVACDGGVVYDEHGKSARTTSSSTRPTWAPSISGA